MYLSSLLLNPRSRQVQRDIGNLYELHRSLMTAFPDDVSRKSAEMLYRLDRRRDLSEAQISLLVQSSVEPDWQQLQARSDYLVADGLFQKSIKVNPHLSGHYRFYLRANPTRRDSQTRRLIPLLKEEQLMVWLKEKGARHGFSFLTENLLIRKMPPFVMYKKNGDQNNRIEIQPIDFSGVLLVEDEEKLLAAWHSGVGRGRSFGCGLLSLARV